MAFFKMALRIERKERGKKNPPSILYYDNNQSMRKEDHKIKIKTLTRLEIHSKDDL